MTVKSTGPFSDNPGFTARRFVPFQVYGRFNLSNINPMRGNRWEKIRAQQKVANLVEMTLQDLVEKGADDVTPTADDYRWFFSFPTAWTPAFGNEPARITLSGQFEGSVVTDGTDTVMEPVSGSFNPPKKIADDNNRIQYSSVELGPGYNTGDLQPVDVTNDNAAYIRDTLGALLQDYIEIIKVEVSTVTYGRGGRHFNAS